MRYRLSLFIKLLRTKPGMAMQYFLQAIFGGPLVFKIAGRKFYQHKDAATLYLLLDSYSKLEKMVNMIPEYTSGVIIDGGANNGLFSFLTALRFPSANIIALEPSQTLKVILDKNFRNLPIELVPKALLDKSGRVTLYTSESSDQVSSIFVDNVGALGHKEIGSIEVEAISLSDLLKERNIEKIAVLKLDVQGAEYQILKNADHILEVTDYLIIELMFIEPSIFDLMDLIRAKFPHYTVINKVAYGADILFSKKDLGSITK